MLPSDISSLSAAGQTLQVGLGERSYPILIGRDLPSDWIARIHGRQVLLVSNPQIAGYHLAHYQQLLEQAGKTVAVCLFADGEQYKTLEELGKAFDVLMANRFNRDCTLVALGGGVVGDMTGFAAASFQRGVDFVQVPTTLLAQVDSSVGGKTGVNHPLGKNMIGAFKQPVAVICDLATLDTLPPREFAAGLAEIIKYALIRDLPFLSWLEDNMPRLLARDDQALSEAIYRSCQHKADIVARDEFESGERALLNLGHTFGHAIETAQGYGNYLHGEAVAIGMLMAADLSARQGWLSATDVSRVRQVLQQAGLPVEVPAMTVATFRELMAHDKKVKAGQLRLVLLQALGQAIITSDYDPVLLDQTLAYRMPGQTSATPVSGN